MIRLNTLQAVPLRRFDATHWWFDYSFPDTAKLKPGQLVSVPFRNQTLTAVVWSVGQPSQAKTLRPIHGVITAEPIVTDWQRQVMETIAVQTCSSLGHVARSFIPAWPKRKTRARLDGLTWQRGRGRSVPSLKRNYLWYRDRQQAVRTILRWLRSTDAATRCVIVPTIDDGFELQTAVRQTGGEIMFVSSHLTPAQFRSFYQSVLDGKVSRFIGTGMAIGLPYRRPPKFLIDQEEHPSHKLSQQQPRFDAREVLQVVQPPVFITSPAPSLRWYMSHPGVPESPPQTKRNLWSFHEPTASPWFTQPAADLLDEASPTSRVFVIAPQHGYASLMRCRECGYVRNCPWCGATVRLFASRGQLAVCRNCHRTLPESLRCPNCRGLKWFFSGLGVDRVRHLITTLQPSKSVGWIQDPRASITVGTYMDAHQIATEKLVAILLLSGDALVSWPDFSAQERAWQFLHRLQAWHPSTRIAIQTFHPDQDFWQNWLAGNDRRWYEGEIALRKRLGLPPWREHWVARRPKTGPGPSAQAAQARVRQLHLPHVRIELSSLHTLDGKMVERLVLSGPGRPALRTLLPWQEIFPYPWQVDTKPTSWLL